MQSFDQVVAFYCENYAVKSAEKQKRDAKLQQAETSPLQFHMEPMDIDHSATGSSTTTTSTTSPASKAFEEELGAVETTLTWYV